MLQCGAGIFACRRASARRGPRPYVRPAPARKPAAGKNARPHTFVTISLDATYSLDRYLSGVGVYSRKILWGVTQAHPDRAFRFCYRPHRFLRSFQDPLPHNASRKILHGGPPGDLFHALNQRVDERARRTVATFHDLFVLTGDYSTPDFRARFADQARSAAANSDLIIAVSQFTANQVRDLLGVDASRIRVIPHGVDPPRDSNPAKREPMVLCVGAIQKRKNIARLVHAFDRMPAGWRLVLAGAVDGFGAEAELRAVENSPRKESIQVTGYVDAKELESLYQRASIFAFPSLDEGFGMPVLEAMSHGVPVITSRRSAVPEVAGDAALLIDPEDAEELSGALARLAENPELRYSLRERGHARALQFTWTDAVARTWAVYQELI
jgi:glycosyltransferase involved in cell wall biosynthesis